MTINRAKRWGLVLIFAGFAIGVPSAWLLLAPDLFKATVKVEVNLAGTNWYDFSSLDKLGAHLDKNTIYSLACELRWVTAWGRGYANGRALNAEEFIEFLKEDVQFSFVSNNDSAVVYVSATSENFVAAAKIANLMANEFCNVRYWVRTNIADILHDEEETAEQNIKALRLEVDRLKKELESSDLASEKSDSKFQSYREVQKKLERWQRVEQTTGLILSCCSPSSPASIIDQAKPPDLPIGPNRTLGKILIGVGALSLLAGVRFLWRAYFAAPTEMAG